MQEKTDTLSSLSVKTWGFDMKMSCKVLLSGEVQGVGFRYFAYRRARKLGICGYVRNLTDGRVEIVASGDKSALESFLEDVRRGPMMARVADVEIEPVDAPDTSGFVIE